MRSLINPKIMLLTIVFHKVVALFILQSASLYYSPLPKKSCNYRSNYGSKQNKKKTLIQEDLYKTRFGSKYTEYQFQDEVMTAIICLVIKK